MRLVLSPWSPVAAGIALATMIVAGSSAALAQTPSTPIPPPRDLRVAELVDAVSTRRIESDIRALAAFGTRHTLSDTLSDTRGIGAARRWIKAEMDEISAACGGCLEVYYQRSTVSGERRIPDPVDVVNVIAVLPGVTDPDRYVIMSGDIDSRATDAMDATSDAPGANDNASGMAGVLEAARVISGSGHDFAASIVFAGLSGEEQGLFGGQHMAEVAREEGWNVEAVLNNDMIGNIQGQNGVADNTVARVFSESPAANTTLDELRRMRFFGGEVDSPSRQIARYVDRIADAYVRNLDMLMIYRLDRFGRGGHHRPFNDAGFPAVRIMEAHEDYRRQHQDLRVEDGVEYGDVIEEVEFDFAAKLTALNVATLASLAFAPAPPDSVRIAGAVEPAARLSWEPPGGDAAADPNLAGYKVYWRLTTAPNWTDWTWVGEATEATMEGLVIDNYYFGVAAVGRAGNESPVVFPEPGR